ncbi:Adenylate kinase [Paenibacillus sp. UNCCL117]|nr:Adenylate kinase [Paenibacillus sp. cl123]SFW64862.1 Adenylate kinase [Paenibacillus sp. UNCCL117]
MRKIFIIGIVASGKTTLAKRLSEALHIPWYELDAIVHHQTATGRRKRTADEQVEVIQHIDKNGEWIFEGTDRASYRCLFDMADTIIFLDTPLWKRKIRIFTRFIKQNLGLEKCGYQPDREMLRLMYQWTREFEENRADFESRLHLYEEKMIRLYDSKDMSFAAQLRYPAKQSD